MCKISHTAIEQDPGLLEVEKYALYDPNLFVTKYALQMDIAIHLGMFEKLACFREDIWAELLTVVVTYRHVRGKHPALPFPSFLYRVM